MRTGRTIAIYFAAALVVAGAAFAASLAVGRYPIDWAQLAVNGMDRRVFLTLRVPRTCMALVAGFALGVAGSVYQTVFQNPLAAPDVIGVASGASTGAAAAILLFAIVMTITCFNLTLSKRHVHY